MQMSTLTQQEIEQIAGGAEAPPPVPPYNPFGPGGIFDETNKAA